MSASKGQVALYTRFMASYINLADSLMYFLAQLQNIYGYFMLENQRSEVFPISIYFYREIILEIV